MAVATSFSDRLAAAIRKTGNPVCVGLDPRAEQLPMGVKFDADHRGNGAIADAYSLFCRGVIDVVADMVPIIKPQAAFFEQLGPAGCQALADVVHYARSKNLLVLIDGKRNDIGSTAEAYADGYLGTDRISPWGGDALTVSPYLGDDSLTPFVKVCRKRSAGLFVLVKTSNAGGGMFQDLVANGKPIYRHVGDYVEQLAVETLGQCGYGSVGAVVGATYPKQQEELRAAMPHTWFLVPGYGSQGATAADVATAFDANGLGAIVNNSRGIIFAHANKAYAHFGPSRWQDAVRASTADMIAQLRTHTPVGKLPTK